MEKEFLPRFAVIYLKGSKPFDVVRITESVCDGNNEVSIQIGWNLDEGISGILRYIFDPFFIQGTQYVDDPARFSLSLCGYQSLYPAAWGKDSLSATLS